jgi:hypothetical protein
MALASFARVLPGFGCCRTAARIVIGITATMMLVEIVHVTIETHLCPERQS